MCLSKLRVYCHFLRALLPLKLSIQIKTRSCLFIFFLCMGVFPFFVAPVGAEPRMRRTRSDCTSFRNPQRPLSRLPVGRGKRSANSAEQRAQTKIKGTRCVGLEPYIAKIAPGQEQCYSRLFYHESTCRQRVTHRTPPATGYGLCAIEKSADLREDNNRGPECDNIYTLMSQIRCCRHLMRSTKGRYFKKVRNGKLPRCY